MNKIIVCLAALFGALVPATLQALSIDPCLLLTGDKRTICQLNRQVETLKGQLNLVTKSYNTCRNSLSTTQQGFNACRTSLSLAQQGLTAANAEIAGCEEELNQCQEATEARPDYNCLLPEGSIDLDQDGWTDVFEMRIGTNPCASDTDGDGFTDSHVPGDIDGDGTSDSGEGGHFHWAESCTADPGEFFSPLFMDGRINPYDCSYWWGNNPLKYDTDGNGSKDSIYYDTSGIRHSERKSWDRDWDGLSTFVENLLGSNPDNGDSDGDLLLDGDEYYKYGTNLFLKDTDGDGISDYVEIADGWVTCPSGQSIYLGFGKGLDPKDPDTDGDGVSDLEEYCSR